MDLQTRVQIWGCPESIELNPMTGIEQNPVRMGGDPFSNRARQLVTVAGVGGVGLNGHHPWLLDRHACLSPPVRGLGSPLWAAPAAGAPPPPGGGSRNRARPAPPPPP